MNTATMIGSRRNRCLHGNQECPYGCCRDYSPTRKNKNMERRIVRRRENRTWKEEVR